MSLPLLQVFYKWSEEPTGVIFTPPCQGVPRVSLGFTKADIWLLFINTGELQGGLITQLLQRAISVSYKINLDTSVTSIKSQKYFSVYLSVCLSSFLCFCIFSCCCLLPCHTLWELGVNTSLAASWTGVVKIRKITLFVQLWELFFDPSLSFCPSAPNKGRFVQFPPP